MNNLARIVSHGFAIVVVILLGIGFIYRGQLFPDLELPDFLLPESDRVAGTGDKLSKVEPEREPAGTMVPGEGAEQPSSSETAAESVPVVPAVPAAGAPSATPETAAESAPEPSLAVSPREVAPSETPIESAAETRQPVAGAAPPPAAEEARPGEGAAGGTGEAAPGATNAHLASSAPAMAEESPAEPEAGASGTGAGTTAEPAISAGISPETGTSGGAPVQRGSLARVPKEESSAAATPPEGTVTPPGMTVPGSPPLTAAKTQSGGTTAGQPSGSPATPVKPYELLAAAREAFWLHNYEDAEKDYRSLTELEPQNPDGYGELGNMYFSQGRWDEAAAAYYEAGVRLVREGRLEPARALVNVIRGLNGKQADDLEKLISSAATSGEQ
jgi:hypothetical protein